MAEKEKYNSMKRFGPRYGRINKIRVAKLESQQRKSHKCPYCSYIKVKRVNAGIWHCKKCDETCTGKAYTPTTKMKEVHKKSQLEG
jgi:large subunit ribosomal protein L37Ae